MNMNKTKFLVVGPRRPQPETLLLEGENQPIERVPSFVYLGTTVDEWGRDEKDILRRITEATRVFGRLRRLFFHPEVPEKLKYQCLIAFVYPTLAHGSETWVLAETARASLDAFWMHKIRCIRGITKHDHVPNRTSLERLDGARLSWLIQRRRRRYYGHIVRYPPERWIRKVLNADMGGKRAVGRGKITWREDVRRELRALNASTEDCVDRDLWREVEKGIVIPRKPCAKGRVSKRRQTRYLEERNRMLGIE